MGTASFVISLILTIVCTVLILVFITPDKKREGLNPFFKFLHDLFNFRWLLVEKLLKVLYIFATLYAIFGGFFTLFAKDMFGAGLLMIILGPIVFRFIFEGLMMFVLVVKNVISINNKLGGGVSGHAQDAPAQYTFCSQCGTRYDKSQGPCPNCGHKN